MSDQDTRKAAISRIKDWEQSVQTAKIVGLDINLHMSINAAESVLALARERIEESPKPQYKILWLLNGVIWTVCILDIAGAFK